MDLLSPRPSVGQIKPYRPVRPPRDGRRWIDLSLTHNPLGPSPLALDAYCEAATRIHCYPDWDQEPLRHAIARRHSIDFDHVVCTAGSEELIHLVAQAFAGPGDEVLCHERGYRGFLKAIRAAGATAVIAAERDMVVDVEALIDRASERTRICFLANPNNPTGTYIPADAVQRLRAGLPPHTLLVLDSAYADYCRLPDYSDGTEIVENSDNVMLIRTFSKMHGLAGLRVGWGYGPATVIEAVNAIRGTFNVSLPAQLTAAAALSDAEHEEATFAHNAQWLPWLSRELERVGLRVYPSVCNFVLARVPTDPSLGTQAVVDHLAHRGILVKAVTEYGLSDCLRITVGREEENKALVVALAEILG